MTSRLSGYRVPLTQGGFTTIDEEDRELVGNYIWGLCGTKNKKHKYAQTWNGVTTIKMHHLIMGNTWVDHINGNGLDNRRANLRPADPATNAQNQGVRKNNKSGYKGVFFDNTSGHWRAELTAFRKRIPGGLYSSPEKAARAYDALAREHHKNFAFQNFPGEVLIPDRIRQNQHTNKKRGDNTSGFKGVHQCGDKWVARISVNGARLFLGSFSNPSDAARAYDNAAQLHFGDTAYRNFPEDEAE